MKMNRLFTTAIVLCFITGTTLFAQVKIGANPSTINPANNLEIEASTAGRAVAVDKTTGKVTIKDGSEGNEKVLTSDANGVATWQVNGNACSSFEASRSTSQNVVISGGVTTLIADTESYDPNNAYDPSTGQYTIPSDGFYIFNTLASNILSSTTARTTTMDIHSANRGVLTNMSEPDVPYTFTNVSSPISANYLLAGDKISIRISITHVAASGTKPAVTIPVSNIRFTGTRVDCNKN
ncbi:hypothetical protein [Dyadobacter tibetensis]|uniref:hypothetical protein n=1 Tax=Dyadobacter tibetensis TaxID=1211851 RepID=UPI000470DDEF|nr:hypothetical protein [Dyadobacter tibetensis]